MKPLIGWMNRHRISILLPLLLVGAVFVMGRMLRGGSTQTTVALESRPVVNLVYGLGTVEADRIFNLRLGINARVEKVFALEGDRVRAGQALVRFDNIPSVSSPIDGVVTALHYRAGETAFAGNAVLTVMNLKEVHLQVGLEERAAVQVRVGQSARVRFDALGKRKFQGVVKGIYPGNGQFVVKVSPPDPLPTGILPGMTADVAIETRSEESLIAPVAALPPGVAELQVVRDGKTVPVPVEVLSRGADGVAVRGDLKAGEKIRLPR